MPTWQWPGQFPDETHADTPAAEAHASSSEPGNADTADESEGNTRPKNRKHWGPRTCRICLENVQPTFNTSSDEFPDMFQPSPSVTYEDEQGRLLRPCRCKGSQKYVHEKCLQAWRHADPSYGRRNFWQCPTCGYRYRLARVQWGSFVSSVGKSTFGVMLRSRTTAHTNTASCSNHSDSNSPAIGNICTWLHCRPYHQYLHGPIRTALTRITV